MDPSVIATLTAVVSAVVGGAAGEAGKSAWGSLTALARRRFGTDAAVTAALEQADTRSPEETTRVLVDHAHADAEFGRSLTDWAGETARLLQYKHDVSNTIGGDARITGTVVQAGDISGSINIGTPGPPDRR
ncbi:hypothetical protein ACFPOI_32205 [Nonomuraea angiospora]|uniref:Uncharacterized protein YPO0396 n=1 Tax=Nonomuraea angiospora TaxID=46172 RepID=A0ABR9LS42_9ACTN|nr:hypothetical protein [Nonomuraea angiospora]MBE1583490.1 uncharacterized protein YPO0396 [Nonomuraea angiospora]MDX3102685.1 hypothetical protein [Nonomuraea angiospora]